LGLLLLLLLLVLLLLLLHLHWVLHHLSSVHIHSVSSRYDIQVDSLVLAPAPALGLVLDFEIVASEEPAVQSDSGFAAAAVVAVAAEQAVFPVVSLLDFDPAPVQQQDQEQD